LQVIVPGADGMFGVLPGHVPIISELKPGVLEVTKAPGEIEKYFISSGFVFAHADSTVDICGIEVLHYFALGIVSCFGLATCPATLYPSLVARKTENGAVGSGRL
jgi:hypothetical protein